MASISELKELHDQYFDFTMLMDTYLVRDSAFIDDAFTRMLPVFNNIFMSGCVKGEVLIDLAYGPFFEWTFPACDYFSDIILGGSTDKCIAELEKWWKNEPGALDWSHAAKAFCELQGNREEWPEVENRVKGKITKVVKYDVSKCNPLFPTVLPQADCLLLPHCLEIHVTDKEEFCRALKNVSSLLKNGGHLVMIACLKQTFFMIGSFKFPHLYIDECSVREALGENNYVIKELKVFPRKVYHLYDLVDYESIVLVHAQKEIPV
ncbi:nicotinamide N-methyltransferase-like [Pleurodeles waltl]